MQINDFKGWHWVVIGVVVGLLFSLVLTQAGPPFAGEELDTVDASTFEHALLGRLVKNSQQRLNARFHPAQPDLRNVVVHPPLRGATPPQYWVTGQLYDVRARYKNPADVKAGEQYVEQWRPFKYPAPAPYPGQNGAVGTFPTVTQYLAAAQKVEPELISYRLAWQERPEAIWSLPPVAGLLLVGVAWPLSLGLMRRMGMAPPPRVTEKRAKVAPAGGFPVQLTPSTAGVRVAPPAAPPPPPPDPHEDNRRYGGEFYPVVKGK